MDPVRPRYRHLYTPTISNNLHRQPRCFCKWMMRQFVRKLQVAGGCGEEREQEQQRNIHPILCAFPWNKETTHFLFSNLPRIPLSTQSFSRLPANLQFLFRVREFRGISLAPTRERKEKAPTLVLSIHACSLKGYFITLFVLSSQFINAFSQSTTICTMLRDSQLQ